MTRQEQLVYANALIDKGNAILKELQAQDDRAALLIGVEQIDLEKVNEEKMAALMAIEVTEDIAIERAKPERLKEIENGRLDK